MYPCSIFMESKSGDECPKSSLSCVGFSVRPRITLNVVKSIFLFLHPYISTNPKLSNIIGI